MHGFDAHMKLQHYPRPEDIVETFIPVRRAGYVTRKSVLLEALEAQAKVMRNKARFVNAIIEGDIPLVRSGAGGGGGGGSTFLSNDELAGFLREKGYAANSEIFVQRSSEALQMDEASPSAVTPAEDESNAKKEYAYLLDMSISSLTLDKANTLNKRVIELETQLEVLNKTTADDMWLNDLHLLEAELCRDPSFRK